MTPFFLAGLLLLGAVGDAVALALSGRPAPDHDATGASQAKRSFGIAVISSRLDTIYLSGDPRKPRTADFGFEFLIAGDAWAPCPVTVIVTDDCMVGSCVDNFLCSKGCGSADRPLSTVSCTKSGQFCSTAFLTIQRAAQPVTSYGCANDVSEDNYMGFTTDPPLVEDLTTSKSATSSIRTTSSGPESTTTAGSAKSSIARTTEPPSNTPTPGPAAGPDPTSSSVGASNNVNASNNTGAIIGGAVGCVALLGMFGLAIAWLLRRNKNGNAMPPPASSGGTSVDGKPEMEASERERAELFGRGLTEMSARGPAAYDTSRYRPNYPPMTPVELPTARGSWL